ncbi:transketolase [candidate division WWE3 bacterium RIFOXYD1_FULL_39_9]|uniref:Transketolase n=1 Tax=candidate division WWE3 bacterium RIFOXYD1_FULL_39_9 TaxID=1802649 RepID=A0A1F4X5E7_UNCKA|nr:MAG: transketolase [candidate division WWE3 bacterium RIFOXYD1_FULL_39_9]
MPDTHLHCQNPTISALEVTANELRKTVIQMLLEAGSGHSAGSLGTADIFAALYFHVLNVDPKKPDWDDRDRFVLSNGHICPVWYATLSEKGFFPKKELWTLRKINSRLQGHPALNCLPGIENSSGSLGQGISQAVGMALAAKMDSKNYRVFVMTGDGELNEGQVWEAAMYAGNKDLNNLVWIIDRNYIQIDGRTEDVQPLENLREKLEAFNWFVIEVDGHNIEEIINACNMAKAVSQRPTAIIAHTIPGKGVEFMEYKVEWHGKAPNKSESMKALRDLRSLDGKISCEYD